MHIVIIAVFLASTLFGFLLRFLTISRMNDPVPENVKDVFDEERYKKNQAYGLERAKFSIISGAIGMVVTLLILLLNFHAALFDFISMRTGNVYLTSLFILFVPILISLIVSKLVGIYSTFGIEAKYGFNKTTPATFILDFIKMFVIMAVIGGGLLSLFLLLHGLLGDWVFLAFFFVLIAFQLFVAFVVPIGFRIFYKLTPLEDGELKTKIESLASKTGYKLKGIYMVDASKRSTKLNAFAAGFGKTKTIGLFDTLVEKLTSDEVVAVLAHEIGHAKKSHILKRTPLNLVEFGVMVIAAYFIVTMPAVSQAFGFADVNMAFGLYILFILLSPLALILQIPENALSRKHEYEADAFEKEHSGVEVGVSALKKLARENLANLTPHPFVVMMEYTHPPISQRIAALEGR